MGLNFASLGENIYTVTFENLLCPLLAVQAKCSCSPSLTRILPRRRSWGWRDAGGWRLSGGIEENRGGRGLGIAIPVPPLEQGGQVGF